MTINNKIFNASNVSNERIPLFLGESLGLFDTVNKQYPEIWALYKKMKSMNWDENEFDYSTCLTEFKTCDKSVYDIMIKTLAWQWEADSIASRSVGPVISCFNPCSELWAAWQLVGDNECVTGDHEVLTPKGWKRIDEINEYDKVAQWDYSTRGITFVIPSQRIVKHHEGILYHFYDGNRNLSQVVTPNHRMPVIYPYWTNDNQPQFKLAENSHYHGGNGFPSAGFISNGGRHMTAQERMWVAVQADGSLCSDKYTGVRTDQKHYKFSFKKQRKINRLFELCHATNWQITEINVTSVGKEGYRSFYVYVPLTEYNPLAKTFDWFNLDEISYEWAMDFLDEIKHWDGNINDNGRTRYISSNKQCIDKVVALAHITGQRGHVTVIRPRFNVLMPSGHYSNTKEAYQVHICDGPYITGNSVIKSVIEYSGNVHCVTVPTGYFLIRHNGAVSVTGNCLHSATYSEIVRNSFDDPSEIKNEILKVKESIARLETVGAVFCKAYTTGHKYALGQVENNQETYNDVFMFCVGLLVLERIQFMSSFSITFAICKTGAFGPIGNAVQKIAADELDVHVQLDKAVLRNELGTERGMVAFNQCKDLIQKLIDEVVESEFSFTEYAFSEGRELVGVTPEKIKQWILFCAKDVYTFFGLNSKYDLPKVNPLKYMETWLNISDTQKAPMEEDPNNYKVNILQRTDENKIFDVDF